MSIPTVAIVLTIVFDRFCLLDLLFPLIEEMRYNGSVAVSVTGEGLFRTTQFPAGPQTGAWAAAHGGPGLRAPICAALTPLLRGSLRSPLLST